MAATLADPLLGHLVDGRYEVLSRIARGGMATVYLARDRRLDRDVALKVMHPHLAEGSSGAEFVARFRREARAAARLTHPGLVGVFDQGVDGETSYLTMEYVDGTNLRRRLGDDGTLSVGDALRTAEAVLDALTAAHRIGLVHRDVKPENVLLAEDGRVKLADFGLARAVTEVTSTTTGTIFGTVAYLAPELVTHGISDTRTDVYAVGILLYEMLTGRQPFSGATPIQVAYQHVHGEMPDVSATVPWLPVEVDELVGALAAREPQDRPTDARGALDLVRRTRIALDAETLDRRADAPAAPVPVPDDDEPGDEVDEPVPATDPDATQALHVERPAPKDDPGAADDADDESMSRTIALRIGTGLDPEPPADEPSRGHRRRNLLLGLGVLVLLLLGGGTWWFMTAGPGAWTTVPEGIVGAELAVAEAAITDRGLEVSGTAEVFHPDIPFGSVVATDPGPGERVRKDGSVAIQVSKGPDLRTVPAELAGKPLEEAVTALTDAGFTVPDPQHAYDDVVAAGLVIGISAQDGESLPVNTEITVTVSDGPEPVEILSVVGADAATAKQQLEAAGLRVAEAQDYSEEFAAGVVMSQSPEGGTPGHRTDTVTITISQGPPLIEVPDVGYGAALPDAKKMLEDAGFKVAVERTSPFLRLNRVIAQSPEGGTQAPKGSTITLTIT